MFGWRNLQDYVLQRSNLVGARLHIKSGGCGFFGDVFMALNGLRFAELHSIDCQVNWGMRSLYYEAGREDVWKHYFEDSVFAFAGGRVKGIGVPYFPGADTFVPYPGLGVRASVNAALAKFCRPQPRIRRLVDNFIHTRFTRPRTLGLHIRATDTLDRREDRKAVKPDDFVRAATSWLKKAGDAQIFLATDDASVAERIDREFGVQVVQRNCIRSVDGASLHGHYDRGTPGSASQKGEEVLVDALLLASCDYLIRSHSRVTCYSICVNLGLRWLDLDRMLYGVDRTPWLRG